MDQTQDEADNPYYRKSCSRYSQWWADMVKHHLWEVYQHEKRLSALSYEELEAQLIVYLLLPKGRPQSQWEQIAFIKVMHSHSSERARHLILTWWPEKVVPQHFFTECVEPYLEAGWESHSEELIAAWIDSGPQSIGLMADWAKRVMQKFGSASSLWLAQMLDAIPERCVNGCLIWEVLEGLPSWQLESRRPVLPALIRAEEKYLNRFYCYDNGGFAVEILEKLYGLDSGPTWERKLHGLLETVRIYQRLWLIRRLKLTGLEKSFVETAYVKVKLAWYERTLSRCLNRKYVRPGHRRCWHRFLALKSKVQQVSDKTLRNKLLSRHTEIVKKTSCIHNGLVLAALNTHSSKAIRILPVRQK